MSDETNEAGPGDVREVLEVRSAMPSEAKGDRTDSVTTSSAGCHAPVAAGLREV